MDKNIKITDNENRIFRKLKEQALKIGFGTCNIKIIVHDGEIKEIRCSDVETVIRA